MTLRASLNENISDTSFWVGQVGVIDIPIETNHSSGGSSDDLAIWVFDDGARDSDALAMGLEYRNVYFSPKGKRTRLITLTGMPLSKETSQVPVENGTLYGQGTKLVTDPINGVIEEMWIRNIEGNNMVVDRGQNNTVRLEIPSGTWLEAKPDHIYLSLTGQEDSWVRGTALKLPDITESWKAVKLYLKVSTGALKTQIKEDIYFRISGKEYPKL